MAIALTVLILFVGIFFVIDNKINVGKLSDSIGNPNIRTKNIHSDVEIYANDYELIKTFDYVFIGQVIEEVETKQPDGKGITVPYTFYKVKEMQFLKGEKPEKEGLICFYGGMQTKNFRVLCEYNDELLIEKQYYLFLMNKRAENSVNSTRIGENDYVLARNDQKVLLNGFDENKSFLEQSENINYTISRVSNIINKELNNYSFKIPTFNSAEEIVAYYDFINLVKVYPSGVFNLEGGGMGSEIPAALYGYNFMYTYKYNGNSSSYKKIYAYGTNFWEGEKVFENYTPLLEDGGCYLIFANKKDSNDQNNRIKGDDYVLYGIHQIVKIDESILNEYFYDKSSEEVKKFIESYFPLNK
jgi:fructose-specific phosphotransferase system component IIB